MISDVNDYTFGSESNLRTTISEIISCSEDEKDIIKGINNVVSEACERDESNNDETHFCKNAVMHILNETSLFDRGNTGKLDEYNLIYIFKYLGISVRYNLITHKLEVSGDIIENYGRDNANFSLVTFLDNTLNLKRCTCARIERLMQNIGFDNRYNPVLDLIRSKKWDNKDRLHVLFDDLMQIPKEDEFSRTLVKKWLMQAYCGLFNNSQEPFSLDNVLVLAGDQGLGKTRLFEKLAMNRLYFGEGAKFDSKDKDTLIQSTSKWITELGEIGRTIKAKEMNSLKAFISSSIDEYRQPYGATSVSYPRMTSLCGTSNDIDYLVDETGNRRFWTVTLSKRIDISSETFRSFDSQQLWAQIAVIVEEERERLKCGYDRVFRLTQDEYQKLNEKNVHHMKSLPGEDEVRDIFERAAQPNVNGISYAYKKMTVSEFIEIHNLKYSSAQIGRVFKAIGIIQHKSNGNRFYHLPYKIFNNSVYIKDNISQ